MTGGPESSRLVAERPRPGPARPYAFPRFSRRLLDSGLTLLSCHLPGRALGAVRLVADAGAETEPNERAGVASLAARALTEGTEARGPGEFAEAVERLGAEIHSDAGWDSAQAQMSVPVSRLEPALELLAEATRRPAFLEREVDRLRVERLNELMQERADPARSARLAFFEAVYAPGSHYARPAGGTPETVSALSRDAVAGHHSAHVAPGSATLVVAGDLEDVPVEKLAERLFGDWPAPAPQRSRPIVEEGIARTSITLVDRPGSVQSHLMIGHAGIPRTAPDYFPVVAMVTVLGGLFSSRLNLKLREEKGYTYGVRASFDFRRQAGPFAVSTAVETSVTAAAVADAFGEIARLHEGGVTEAELREAKDYLVGVFPLAFETPEQIAYAISHLAVYGLPDDYYDRSRPQMEAVTAEEVAQAARARLRPDGMAVVLVGDAARLQEPLAALGLGPLTVVEPPAPRSVTPAGDGES